MENISTYLLDFHTNNTVNTSIEMPGQYTGVCFILPLLLLLFIYLLLYFSLLFMLFLSSYPFVKEKEPAPEQHTIIERFLPEVTHVQENGINIEFIYLQLQNIKQEYIK